MTRVEPALGIAGCTCGSLALFQGSEVRTRWLFRLGGYGLLALGLAAAAHSLHYEATHILPALGRLEPVLESAPRDERAPSPALRDLLRAERNGRSPQDTAARLVYFRFGPGAEENFARRPLQFHGDMLLWSLHLRWHFGPERLDAIVATLSYSGNGGYGLQRLAQDLFGRPLNQLARDELAECVAALRAPNRLRNDPEARRRIARVLLTR